MKFTIDVDCTLEEVRRLVGLPDLTPVHQAYVERMQRAVSESFTGEGVADMLRSFGPMSEAGLQIWRRMFERLPGGGGGGAGGGDGHRRRAVVHDGEVGGGVGPLGRARPGAVHRHAAARAGARAAGRGREQGGGRGG